MTLTEKQNDGQQTQSELHPITTKKTSDMNQSFLRAARGGNLDKVLDLLKHNIDITTCNANGLNALHLACKEGHTAIVDELIKRGAKVNGTTKKGNTPLHIASLAGQLNVVELLIKNKANVNVQSFSGFTPLYMAAQENHIEVVKMLLSNGASQTLATDDGFTPLAVALQQGHDKTVALLLENDSRGKVRLPALHIAAKKDDVKAANLLLNGEIDVDHQSASGFTPLHIAAHYGNINIATVLIERGANVNFQAKNNITPLHVSTKWGHLLMVLKLVESQADLESRTRDGLTPLHCAARSGHATVVDALLQGGANFSAKTRNGLSPLHMAAQGDHVECGKLLVYRGANVDDTTVDYLTPIHVSSHCGNIAITQLLLDKKCEVNARALNGFTPLHIACKKNRLKVVELLLQYGALVEAATESGLTPLHVASYMGHIEIVQLLLARGANPNSVTLRSETPLHLAARSNHVEIVKLLLQNNAAVDARARENQTALHVACRHGNSDMVEVLLHHNASTDPPTKDNYTALHIAVKEGHHDIVKALLDRGAKLEVTTKKGFTPLHLVSKYDRVEIAQMLLNAGSNVNAQGRNGLTPLHVATHYNSQKLINLLMDFKASPHSSAKNGYTALHIAAKKNMFNIAEILLVRGADPNAESRNGFTAVHLASQEGLVDMVTLLLRHNADVNYRAKNGLSAMHLTAQEDQVKVAEVLAASGCQIEAKTKAGYTPLHTACHFGQVNMVRYLLGHGAQANTQTEMGSTALHLAAQQGHLQLIYVLLDSGSDPNLKNTQGWTAAHVAKRQHYLNIFEILKHETKIVETWEEIEEITTSKMELEKPETMAEHPVTDSEDDYGEPDFTTMPASPLFARPRQATNEMYRPLYDQQTSIAGTQGGKLSDKHSIVSDQMQKQRGEDSIHEGLPEGEKITSIRSGREFAAAPRILDWDYTPDNVPISRKPIQHGFLVSFLVDARGGSMRGSRHLGLRVLVPPSSASAPTRVTCRMLRMERVSNPPLLNDGEGLACRVLEMGPRGCKFNSPVLLEVPHFASLREREREIMILRSENGETWKEHSLEATERAVQEAVGPDFDITESNEELREKRIVRILTNDFPYFFALVNRIRMESAMIGSDGGVISSTIVPQVQVVFPEGALQKRIRVGLQAQPITPEQVTKHLGSEVSVAVSPIVTIEPRRRKFHKPITLTIPLPKAVVKGGSGVNPNEATSLRLLCSITGGTAPAQWEDITGSTPLSRVKDCVSFTTTVSARFWLMDCRNFQESAEMAGRLYREVTVVPYMGKFAIFSKQLNPEETLLRCFCLTDDKMDKTLESQEGFELKAVSPEVEVLHDRKIWLETAGNLVPVTKIGCQLYLHFRAFRENRLPFPVRVKDLSVESIGKIAFMKEPRMALSNVPPHQKPMSTLELRLSEEGKEDLLLANGKKKDQPQLDSRGRPVLSEQEINTIVISQDDFARTEVYLKEVAAAVSHDWQALARELGVTQTGANQIQSDYKNDEERAYATLMSWRQETRHSGQGSELERALRRIGREDVLKTCVKTIQLAGTKQRNDLSVEGGEMDDMSADFKRDSNMFAKADTLPRTPMMSSYMTDSSAKESDSDTAMPPPPSETIQADVDSRRPAVHDDRTEEQKRQEQEAKTAALIDLVNKLDAVCEPLPPHLQEGHETSPGGEGVLEGCNQEVDDRRPPAAKMSKEEEERARAAKTAAFMEICNKLDSMAPELPRHLQE